MITFTVKLIGVALGFQWFGIWFIVPLIMMNTEFTSRDETI